jgi:hypothetical protein
LATYVGDIEQEREQAEITLRIVKRECVCTLGGELELEISAQKYLTRVDGFRNMPHHGNTDRSMA